MATMVSTRPRPTKGTTGGPKSPGPRGNGGPKPNGRGKAFYEPYGNRYRLGMWVALAAIVMMFTALTSAYIVRAASSNDWQKLPLPRIVLLSTVLILVSSATLETAKRRLKAGLQQQYARWLMLTALLGCCFLGTQLLAWRQLVRQGVYISTNPHSSFFYLLTAAHGVHLLGGLLAMLYLVLRSRKTGSEIVRLKNMAAADAATLYWHFMDGLWIYLFLLLFYWR
jgi:cytochrome c oxidase subunit 3